MCLRDNAMATNEHSDGVIRNRRHAIIAVILTAIIAVSGLRATLRPVPLQSPWLFEPIYGLPRLKPIFIGLSVFYWAFGLWIVFWFYKAARGKHEQFLLASLIVAFVLDVVGHFMRPEIRAQLEYVSTAAAFMSLVAAVVILATFPQGGRS